MPNINLYDLYNNKLRKLGYSSSTTLQESFVEAVNNVYADLNSMVFQAQSLSYINDFDDVIENRLRSFAGIVTAGARSVSDVISDRKYWSLEVWVERTDDNISGTDTLIEIGPYSIRLSGTGLSVSTDGASLLPGYIKGTATLPSDNSFSLKLESHSGGNRILFNGEEVEIVYTGGDADTVLDTGASADFSILFDGIVYRRIVFSSSMARLLDFPMNEGEGLVLTDSIAGATLGVNEPYSWELVYVNVAGGLDNSYLSVINSGIDYYLQEGGQWAMEDIGDRERKWFGRSIPQARMIHNATQSFYSPLNP